VPRCCRSAGSARPRHHPDPDQQWFHGAARLAISLALNGASFGGIVVAPLLVLLIGATDFRTGMVIAAGVMVAILVHVVTPLGPGAKTVAPALPHRPLPPGRGATPCAALPFWTVSAPFALVLLAQTPSSCTRSPSWSRSSGARAALSVS